MKKYFIKCRYKDAMKKAGHKQDFKFQKNEKNSE